MKRLLLTLLLTLVFSVSFAQTFSYARLSLFSLPAIDATIASWVTPEETIGGESFGDIFTELLGREPEEDELPILTILNTVGQQGWELINIREERDATSTTLAYWFIRRD